MATTTGRATMLGAAGTALMGAATWWLLSLAASAWPGAGPVRVDVGLDFLALGAAGLVAGWATALLAAATVSLATSAGWFRGGSRPRDGAGGTVAEGLTGRVAAGLLVAASLGVAPATAAEPVPAAVVSQDATSPSFTTTTPMTAEADDLRPADLRPADDLPVPGWTPTVTGGSTSTRVTGEVSLVSGPANARADEEVVVTRGDTLWDIAARHLGEDATDQDVAEAWPRWYAANKEVIGADPDLIQPGQRLVVPATGGAR